MLKKFKLTVVALALCSFAFGQTKMGNNPLTIGPNSLLELESANKGFLMSRMTTAQMNAIPNLPSTQGMLVYNTDAQCVYQLRTTGWSSMCFLSQDSLAIAISQSPSRDSIIEIIRLALTADNGLTKTGMNIKLGGALTQPTSITTSGVNTLSLVGIQSGLSTDSIMVIDPVTGVIKRRSLTAALAVATTNTLVKNGLTVTSTVNGIAASITLPSDSSTASNGLNMVGYDTRLGGALTGATTITTTGANTLAISGLQSGTVADSILVADATTGVLKRRAPASLLTNSTTNNLTIVGNTITSNVNGVSSSATLSNDDSTTASNGLNIVGKDVRLGGALTGATTITTTGANTLAVSGLQSGTVADSILVADATTGVMRRRSPEALLNATTTNIANSNGNIHTSTVNGITDTTTIINSNTLSYSGNTLTSNVNGVSSAVNLFLADSTTASNGLNMVGKDVRMGGALTGATTITTTGANTLAVSGLQSGTVADSILVADATTGVMRRRSPEALLNATTTNIANSNGNIHTSTVNGITDTTTIINSNSLTISGNTITSNVNGVSSSATLSNDDSTTASNGLNMVGKDVRMGGALTGATTITTTGANTLAVSGLQSGTVADSILVADATTGVMRRRSPAALLNATTTNIANSNGNIHTSTVNGITDTATIINNNTVTITGNTITTNVNGVSSSATLSNDDSTTASNGLNMVGKDVRMGGALTGATTITTTGVNTLAVSGLQSGTVADSILVADATTGVLKRRAPASLLTNSTTNNLTIVGNTITSNVNGVSSSATLSNDDSTTASNGLNIVGKDVRMGGALTAATTITTTGANTLAVSGLQSGTAADSILVADATTGVMRRRSPSTILASATTNTLTSSANTMTSTVNGVVANAPTINTNVIVVTAPDTFQNVINGVASNKVSLAAAVREPWFDQATGAGATLNTQNIYQMGNVGIGNTAPNSKLQVSGSIALPYRKVVTNVIVDATDYTVLANCTSGNKIFTLPSPASCPNRIYIVGKTDATSNTLTFTEDLYYKEGLFLTSMNYPNTLIIQSDGTNWWILGRSNF